MSEREEQERLFEELIEVYPVESVRDGWHEAECKAFDCHWGTTGLRNICEDAAYEHISEVHMTP